ncbi:unnamed protein product, partial [Mesorhabditis spiculigera]
MTGKNQLLGVRRGYSATADRDEWVHSDGDDAPLPAARKRSRTITSEYGKRFCEYGDTPNSLDGFFNLSRSSHQLTTPTNQSLSHSCTDIPEILTTPVEIIVPTSPGKRPGPHNGTPMTETPKIWKNAIDARRRRVNEVSRRNRAPSTSLDDTSPKRRTGLALRLISPSLGSPGKGEAKMFCEKGRHHVSFAVSSASESSESNFSGNDCVMLTPKPSHSDMELVVPQRRSSRLALTKRADSTNGPEVVLDISPPSPGMQRRRNSSFPPVALMRRRNAMLALTEAFLDDDEEYVPSEEESTLDDDDASSDSSESVKEELSIEAYRLPSLKYEWGISDRDDDTNDTEDDSSSDEDDDGEDSLDSPCESPRNYCECALSAGVSTSFTLLAIN